MDQTILIVVNSAWNLVNFRAGLIKGLKEKGFRVVAVAPVDIDRTTLADLGCEFHEVKLLPQSLNPWGDLLFMVNVLFDDNYLGRLTTTMLAG